MHMSLISILLLASTLVPAGSVSTPTYRIELTHVDANGGFTREELLQRAEDRAELKAAMLSNTDAKYTTSAEYSTYEYLMELEIGESRQRFKAVADTGSEMVWTKKLENCRCDASHTFTRWSCSHPDVISEANPKQVPCGCEASTAAGSCCSKDGPCMFKKSYGSGSASGFMATENLALPGKDPIRARLGCAIDRGNKMLLPPSADGVVGLNSGKDSLVRQLDVKKFAYCLSKRPLDGKTAPRSWLLFGDELKLSAADSMSSSVATTPLVHASDAKQNRVGNLKYHVQLDGISIGTDEMHESVPKESFKLKSDKDGNKGVMFVDSGASITYLEKSVFERLLKLLNMEKFKLVADGNENDNNNNNKKKYCYRLAHGVSEGPQLVLHFHEAKMHLPWANYMVESELGSGLFCLKIGEHKEHSVLGNFQQQNMHMLFDLAHNKLQFALHKDCSNL